MPVIGINYQELKKMQAEEAIELIDVREDFEYAQAHIRGAKLIPMSLVPVKLDEIDWSKKVVMYCRTGGRSYMIANHIAKDGRTVYDLEGGIMEVEGSDLTA
jgi:rhodanese-related sulfurtransferase